MKYILIFLAVALAGCSPAPKPVKGPQLPATVQTLPDVPSESLSLYTLPDGTRCMIYAGYNGRSGVSCDWQPRRVER